MALQPLPVCTGFSCWAGAPASCCGSTSPAATWVPPRPIGTPLLPPLAPRSPRRPAAAGVPGAASAPGLVGGWSGGARLLPLLLLLTTATTPRRLAAQASEPAATSASSAGCSCWVPPPPAAAVGAASTPTAGAAASQQALAGVAGGTPGRVRMAPLRAVRRVLAVLTLAPSDPPSSQGVVRRVSQEEDIQEGGGWGQPPLALALAVAVPGAGCGAAGGVAAPSGAASGRVGRLWRLLGGSLEARLPAAAAGVEGVWGGGGAGFAQGPATQGSQRRWAPWEGCPPMPRGC